MSDNKKTTLMIPVMMMICVNGLARPDAARAEEPKDKLATIQPVPFTAVHLNDAFWAPRIETNRAVTIPYAFGKCEETGRVENFVRAARRLRGEKLEDDEVRGYSFDDTDIYKILEGASFGLSVKADPKMKEYLDGLIEKVAAAQEPDGYLYTARTINPEKPHEWAGKERWENVSLLSHELYNMGHFYEAAVAHHLATGEKFMEDYALGNDAYCETCAGIGNVYWNHRLLNG